MNQPTSFDAFQAQQKYLEQLQKTSPELFMADKLFTEEDSLPKIGITGLDPNRPQGFLRLFPQDFIVEEIQGQNDSSQIESRYNLMSTPEGKFTLYADLVKVGISTLEAINRLSAAFKISPDKIGYAGIKDAQALTSQRIALPGITAQQAEKTKIDGIFLTNLYYGRGTISRTNLTGNAFTIFVRTDHEISAESIVPPFKSLKENGFLNYYQSQRFGGIRLMSHHLGRQILRGDYEGTVRLLLTQNGEYDIKLIKEIRNQARPLYGNWTKIKQLYSTLPYTFQNEIKILSYLEQQPKNFIGALIHIKDQTTLWTYAYASLLFNNILSLNATRLPKELPLLLSDDSNDIAMYKTLLDADEIHDIKKALEPFKFIQLKKRLTPTRIFPTDLMFMSTSEGVICHFILDKGAYATTFLMNIFKLHQGLPLPSWIKMTQCDTKKYLQIGTSEPAVEKLKDYIFSLAQTTEKASE